MKMQKLLVKLIVLFVLYSALPAGQVSAEGCVKGKLDRYIENYLEEYRVPGASVIIVHDKNIFYSRSWGVTGESKRKVTNDTPFTIGSISKSLTGLAVMTLVERNLIELDDPIQKHLPWFTLADKKAAEHITIKQLLTQTSGISTYEGLSVSDQQSGSDGAISDNVKALANVELSAPIGEKHQYSNANFLILGALIEEVTNQRFADYMEQSVMKPLGMDNAAADRQSAYEKGYASGYQSWFGLPRKSTVTFDNGGAPYGYMTASAKDMVQFISFLAGEQSNDMLNQENMALYVTPHVLTGEDRYYGLGIRISNPGSEEEMIWHSGSTPDSHAELFTFPETGWGGVILTNKNNILEEEGLYYLKMGIIEILNGNDPVEFPNNTPVLQSILLLFTGLLAGLVIYFIRKLRTLPQSKKGIWGITGTIFIGVSMSLIPLLIYFTQSPWHAIRVFSPDTALLVSAISALSALNGAISLMIVFKSSSRIAIQHPFKHL